MLPTTWSAGHGIGSRKPGVFDPGATSSYGIEADEARFLTKRLAYDSAACKIPTLFRDTGFFAQADDDAHKFAGGPNIFTEIHFNSGPSGARGVECLVPQNASKAERELAEAYCYEVSRILDIPNRGVKVRGDLAVLNGNHRQQVTIILEVCFISNKYDMGSYRKRIDRLELGIFNAYRVYGLGLESWSKPKPPRLTWRRVRIPRYMKKM